METRFDKTHWASSSQARALLSFHQNAAFGLPCQEHYLDGIIEIQKDPVSNMMMNITNEMRYALRAVFELARREGNGPVKGADIASAQAIPARFLEVILCKLKRTGIVKSKRGYQGGYVLSRSANEITVGSVLEPLETPPCPAGGGHHCIAGRQVCPFFGACAFMPLWDRVRNSIQEVYHQTTIQDLLNGDGSCLTQIPFERSFRAMSGSQWERSGC
jgi:Rrf2 family protein